MKAAQVDAALVRKFLTEDERIVFWDDPNAEFSSYVERGLSEELSAVTVLDLTTQGGLSTKLLLERDDPTGRYLLYRTGPQLQPSEDWLLDIRLYSAEFHADVASIWLQELGLTELRLRDHLEARRTFLASQERRRKLKRLLGGDDNEASIDLKMIAVLAGAEVAGPLSILRAVCHGHVVDGQFDLESVPPAIEQLEKMELAAGFWGLMGKEFGYGDDEPTIPALLRRLLVSELAHEVGTDHLAGLSQFVLDQDGRRNAVVFLTQWRDSSGKAESYDAAAAAIEAELQIADAIDSLELDQLIGVFTFWATERKTVALLRDRVLGEMPALKLEEVSELATARRAGHWLSGPGRDDLERRAVSDAYEAIVAAAELLGLSSELGGGLSYEGAEHLLEAYRSSLFRLDQLYRHFCFKAQAATRRGWSLLKDLSATVERTYEHAYLRPLGLEWSRLLDAGFLKQWKSEKMAPQQRFYEDTIRRHLKGSERARAFVIISDALRYEAAEELTRHLNGRYRMDASLDSMLGVLPSYTTLGMASLLPRKALSYKDSGDVLADGKSVASTDGRNRQLAGAKGMACQASDLLKMKQDEARELTSGKRVVFIYHNVIDARGDSKSTEDETFAAVDQCLGELADLVQICVNKLNAGKVWVTADHGFLFQQQTPDETDKSKLRQKPDKAVKAKKRYIIGRDLGMVAEAHHGYIRDTAGIDDDMEFWVPRGTNRFHFTGGARFIHGGAMPQEVVVPLVTVHHVRGKKKDASRVEKVSVQVLGTNHKITTPKYRFEIIQTEPVSERRKPLTVRAAVYDELKPVTSVETATFDSPGNLEERKKSLRFELLSGDYDKKRAYHLVLRDADNDVEVLRVPVVIDRSFDDDF